MKEIVYLVRGQVPREEKLELEFSLSKSVIDESISLNITAEGRCYPVLTVSPNGIKRHRVPAEWFPDGGVGETSYGVFLRMLN